MIRAEDVRFSYGDHEVLKGMSFESGKDSITSILGPNGTGKTTFLKCICGLNRPSSGRVTVDGEDISGIKGKGLARRIGFVPQQVPVSRMSVFDTVLLGRRPYIEWSASREDIRKAADVIDALGISHLSLKYMDEISGGEFQKVQIARAIAQEPSVLILDEPTNNLDISNQHRAMHTILDIVRSRGMCTIMTMHDINLAVHYSDRFLFVKDGEVAAYGGQEVITEELIADVYGIDVNIIDHRGVPFVVPCDSAKYRHLMHSHPHGPGDLLNGNGRRG